MTGTRRWSHQAFAIAAVTAIAIAVAAVLAISPGRAPEVGAEESTATATPTAAAGAPPAKEASTTPTTATSSPTGTVTAEPSATAPTTDPPPAPTLITVATGEGGVLVLEWTPGAEPPFPAQGVTGWQYRQQFDPEGGFEPREDRWEAWTDVPDSTASTRSHRLTGLKSGWDLGLEWLGVHFFQVRAVAGTVEGDASEPVEGLLPVVDKHGIPTMDLFQIVEGGRTWRLTDHCPTVFDVPTGTRLVLMPGSLRDGGDCWLYKIRDVETGSEVLVDPDDGSFLSREIVQQSDAGEGAKGVGGGRDVNAIFDQIEASARLVESRASGELSDQEPEEDAPEPSEQGEEELPGPIVIEISDRGISIVLGCTAGELEVYVDWGDWGEPLLGDENGQLRVVTLVVGEVVADEKWELSASGTAIFAPSPLAFARALLEERIVVLVPELPGGGFSDPLPLHRVWDDRDVDVDALPCWPGEVAPPDAGNAGSESPSPLLALALGALALGVLVIASLVRRQTGLLSRVGGVHRRA